MEIDDRALRQLRKLGRDTQRRILDFLRERVATGQDPRRMGHALTGRRTGLWRYRVGSHRLVCRIEDDRVAVLVLAVAHRREVYR